MPANNRKLLEESFIAKLELMYKFSYNLREDVIVTTFPNSTKVMKRPADKGFLIIVKKFGKKITFNLDAINIWKELQLDRFNSRYSLFAINNAVTFLKITYQNPTKEKVIDVLKNGIQKL